MTDFENTGVIEVPFQRKLNYSALAVAIVALVMAIAAMFWASSADNNADTVGKSVVALDKAHKAYVEVTDKNLNGIHVELSADATAITVLNEKIEKLEGKSVVAELAKELREGKASKVSVDILREEVILKADAKTVKRLARRLNGFNTRLTTIEGIVLPKDEPKLEVKPAAEQPPAATKPDAKSPVPATTPSGKPEAPAKMP